MIRKQINALIVSFFIYSAAISAQLEKDDFILTHKTSTFPRNGVMIPGLSFNSDDVKCPVNVEEAPNVRLTLHWYGMAMHTAHEKNKNKEKYLLIETGSTCVERLYAGYHEDFMMVGPHMLSPSSVAIVPEVEIENLQAENQHFKGKWVAYNSESETLEQAAKRVLKELNKPNVQMIKEHNIAKLNPIQLMQVLVMSEQDPRLKDRIFKGKDGCDYLIEEVMPHQLNLNVDGIKANAKQYYASVLPKNFNWIHHEATIFNELEAAGSRLFTPLFDLQNPAKINLQLKREEVVEFSKMFVNAYQAISKTKFTSSTYNDMLDGYLTAWKENTKAWYTLIQKQANELKSKPYGQSVLGDERRLKEEIVRISASLKKFDVQAYMHP